MFYGNAEWFVPEIVQVRQNYYVSSMPQDGYFRPFFARMQEKSIERVVVLMTQEELELYYDFSIVDVYRFFGMKTLHYPIRDMYEPRSFESFNNVIQNTPALGRHNENTLVHCIGGNGRSGTLLVGKLIAEGYDPEYALAIVREVRPKAVETYAQWRFLRSYAIYRQFSKETK